MTGPAPEIAQEVLAQRKELVEIYTRAQERLVKRLTSAKLTDFAKFRIQEQLVQINAIIGALNAEVREAMPGVISGYYQHGANIADLALNAQGVKVSALNMGNRIHTAAVKAVAEQMALDLATANGTMKTTATRILRQTQQTLVEERRINQLIADGIVTGESRRETSARLKEALINEIGEGKLVQAGGRYFTPEYYSELVTRTRTREAVTQGAVTRSMEYGITLFQVSIHDKPCDRCAQYQGKVYSITPDSGFPMLEARPPYHPHCLLGETPVFAPGKRAASVATYNGPIVDLRLSNSAFVSVTPNHMFLTPTGFARAKDLREGDDVLCSGIFEDVVLRNPDDNNSPATIADIVKSLSASRGMTTTGVPVSPEDLHGDARFMDGNIDIVGPDSLLAGDIESGIPEHLSHLDFSGTDIGLFGLDGCSDTASLLDGLSLAAQSGMGISRERQAALWAEVLPAEPQRVGGVALGNAPVLENLVNDGIGNFIGHDEIVDAFASQVSITAFLRGNVGSGPKPEGDTPFSERPAQDLVGDSELAMNVGDGSPGAIRVASVVFKGFRNYSGHVYDLQTVSSLYICNGLISSNCRHVLLPYVQRPGKEDQHEAIKALSNSKTPITGGLPGYTEAVAQARETGGLRKKQIQGESRTKTPPVQTGPTGADIRKRIAEIAEKSNGDAASIKQELAKLYPGNPSAERLAAPLKFKATSSMPKAVAEAKFNEGTNAFFRMVSESSLPQGALKPAFHSQKSRRAFYSVERQEVNLQHDDEQKTIIHEMGHWLEHKNQRIANAANAFLEARTKGESAQSLRKLTGNSGYKAHEIAKKDNFKHPYTGKIYPRITELQARKYGYTEGLRTTEIASMGLEAMFDDPWQFAKDDPDFFDFIWDVIMGGKEYP